MRALRFCLLPLLGHLAAAAAEPSTAAAAAAAGTGTQELPPAVPGVFLVEFASGRESREGFFGALAAADMPAEPRLDLAYPLFHGVSFRLANASADPSAAAARIAGLAQVKKVWPVRLRPMPRDELKWVGSARTAAAAAAAGGLGKRQTSDPNNMTTTTFSPHVMTQVDKLRAAGYTGRGLRVAVIDSGVDYTHPALGGGCFGRPECVVSYGRDLVGDAFTGTNAPVPDADPMDCDGHGTHVTGILAARPNALGFTGAAPGVTVGMYKVFGCKGGSSDDVLIAAYHQAYADGSDIITSSIGGASGWTEDPYAVAVERIVAAGVPCTSSAGNDGNTGLFFPSAAATGKGVTAVASVDNVESPQVLTGATYRVVSGANSSAPARVFGWAAGNPAFGNVMLPLWAVSNNTAVEDDACNPLPADTPDLSGYVALVNQGTCAYYLKAQNVADKGAKYMMVISNVPGETSPVYAADVKEMLGTGMVMDTQGAEWIARLNRGERVVVEMTEPNAAPDVLISTPNKETPGLLSLYTSWGPTWEVDLKPQIATPGGEILSTYPLAKGGFAVQSGTSMSCPLAAAIYALVAEARGTTDPALLERVLSATAKPRRWADDAAAGFAPVAQQGAGLAQAYDAAHLTTLLSVASFSFNDTDHFVASANFSIQNLGASEVTYEIGHAPTISMYTFRAGVEFPAGYPNPIAEGHAELAFSSTKVTVPAGGSVDITVVPTAPMGLDASRLPVYGGYITVNATSGGSDELSIPYLGVVGSMYSAPKVLATDWVYLSNYTDPSLKAAEPNTTWVVPYPTDLTDPTKIGGGGVAYPATLVQLNVGTPLLRIDVVPVEVKGDLPTKLVLGVQSAGNIIGYPMEYSPRKWYVTAVTGRLEDGTVIPEGRYRLVIRALRIFGDLAKAEDYDTVETVPFELRYAK